MRQLIPAIFCVRIVVFGALLVFCSYIGHAQRKYYEFNNPAALKLTKERINQLTSAEWLGERLRIVTRHDLSDYKMRDEIVYKKDGTYSSGAMEGTWKVKYNKYLVLTSNEPKKTSSRHPIAGIYSVTSLTDSTLMMMKLHSSSGDMKREMLFRKRIGAKDQDTARTNLKAFHNRISPKVTPDLKLDLLRNVFDESEAVSSGFASRRAQVPLGQLDAIDSLALACIQEKNKAVISLKAFFRQYRLCR